MKSIVIFGGSGFVGRHLIRRLAKNGYKIIVPYQKSIQEAKIRLLGVTGQIIPFRYTSLNDKRLQSILMNLQRIVTKHCGKSIHRINHSHSVRPQTIVVPSHKLG